MCTVTFIPTRETVHLTSNRDEKPHRPDAQSPMVQRCRSGRVLFPRDGKAGGTWIAGHENGNAVVFLNGGFQRHIPKPPYRKSRGLILVEMIDSGLPFQHFDRVPLFGIEPFTAIVWEDNRLYECRWDGEKKHVKTKEKNQPHIWSSVTLYDEPVIQKRNAWFEKWLADHSSPTPDSIIHFHQFTGDGDARNDLRMNREGQTMTVSITQLSISSGCAKMKYMDLKNNYIQVESLDLQKISLPG